MIAFRAMRWLLAVSAAIAIVVVDDYWWRSLLVCAGWWAAGFALDAAERGRLRRASLVLPPILHPLEAERLRAIYMERSPRVVNLCDQCKLDFLGHECPRCAS